MMSTKSTLTLRVIAPEGIHLNVEDLIGITVPLADGRPSGIRPGHAPLIAETEQGAIRYRSAVSNNVIHLYAGVLEIRDNTVTVLTAGEVTETSSSMAEPAIAEYDRLMQTLIQQVQYNDETEQETECKK